MGRGLAMDVGLVSAAEKVRAGLPAGFSVPPAPAPEWKYGTALTDFLGDDEPDDDDSSDWHLRGLIARDVAQLLAGDPKVGKTMIAESWAIALTSGAADWCGFPIYGGRKRVLVMPREDSERTTRVRLWQLARGAGLRRPHDLGNWLEVDPISPLNLANPEHITRLREACKRFDVVIIDSFTTAHTGDENSAKDIAKAMEPAREIAIGTKTAIVFVHHFNGKGNPDDKRSVKHRLRGSSALAGYARHIVGVSHGPERGQLELASDGNLEHQIKPTIFGLVNGTSDEGKKTLSYQLLGLADEVKGAGVRDQVVALVSASENGFKSASGIVRELGGNKQAILAAVRAELEPIRRLVKRNGRIYSRSSVPEPFENRSVPEPVPGSAPYKGAPEPHPERTPEFGTDD